MLCHTIEFQTLFNCITWLNLDFVYVLVKSELHSHISSEMLHRKKNAQ